MRYFSDEQINEMKERVRNDFSPKSRAVYMMYVNRIEELNKQYDEGKVTIFAPELSAVVDQKLICTTATCPKN